MCECVVCFEPIVDDARANACEECFPLLTEKDDAGFLLHPIKRVRLCRCGKEWKQDCAHKTLLRPRIVDMEKIMQLSDPVARRNARRDPAYWKEDPEVHGFAGFTSR